MRIKNLIKKKLNKLNLSYKGLNYDVKLLLGGIKINSGNYLNLSINAG